VSDAQRERVLATLRDGYAQGRLSDETFLHRVDAVLRARFGDELGGTVADLAKPRRLGAALTAVGRLALEARDRWLRRPAPRSGGWYPSLVLALPTGTHDRYTIGRELACDMALAHESVSRVHASLQRDREGWLLEDLGSTNGTRLNGWRVTSPSRVSAGDVVSFGAVTFVLTDRPPPPPAVAAGG
jgi:hypothetical protein